MSFVDLDFLAFLPAVLLVYRLLGSRSRQNLFLLLASYVFYGWVHPWMCALLFGVTALNYLGARAIVAYPARRDLVLGAVILLSLADLAVFKYFGWFAEDILPRFLEPGEAGRIAAWKLALPLGLSFYTFHNLSYTIEVHRGRFPVKTDPVDCFLYGSWFPQLVAGPVERAANIFPQLERERPFSWDQLGSGLGLLLWGAFKKVALADAIAPYVDLLFLAPEPSWAMVWAGALGFTIQALADFSGYTDMARGVSRMFGIELMQNFAHPYLAATPMEFWQRWHISFSTWLRDYVYVPACFSEWVRRWLTLPFTGEWGPFAITTRALLLTMLASGIWHGSTWNYVLWGLYYFLIGTVYAAIQPRLPKAWRKDGRWRWATVPLMFGFTVFGMHIFREPSVPRLWAKLQLDPTAGSTEQWTVALAMLGLCAYAALPLVAALLFERHLAPRLAGTPWWPPLRASGWALFAVAVFASVRMSRTDFIYFQF